MLKKTAAVLALSLLVAPAFAEEAKDVIKWRKAMIGSAGYAALTLKAMGEGKIDGDADAMRHLAHAMVEAATSAKDAFSHDTTGVSDGTKASDKIWSDWDDFSGKMDKYIADAKKIAELADAGDSDAMFKQLGATFRNCGGCHKPYQTK